MPKYADVVDWLRSSRVPIAILDTPLEPAGLLPSGRRLFIKRDDLTGLGLGGNKARKAEMLCADAIRSGADTLVTIGAEQSNHARVTAAAGARCNLETHLVLGEGRRSDELRGNQLLSTLFGATLHAVDSDDWGEFATAQRDLVDRLRSEGRHPYAIPMGGSSPVGASAFVLAWFELVAQIQALDTAVGSVVVTSSTGGTHAGMVSGRALAGGPPIVAIDVAKASGNLAADTRQLAERVLELAGCEHASNRLEVIVDGDHVGPGYAVPTQEADDAMVGLAESGGWVLDRVYTAKGFAGLLALDAAGRLGSDDVVFWHTGGQPAVFADNGAPAGRKVGRLLTTTLEGP